MSAKLIYRVSHWLQRELIAIGHPLDRAPRIQLDAWASLLTWHQSGEQVWRIREEQAERLLDEPLPAELDLATAPTRGHAVCYTLPDRREWIVLARIPANHTITVHGDLGWAYRQPVLTYCTTIGARLASGYLQLLDQPHPPDLALRPGTALFRRLPPTSLAGVSETVHSPSHPPGGGPGDGNFSQRQLGDADIVEEDYRVSLAIAQHYRP